MEASRNRLTNGEHSSQAQFGQQKSRAIPAFLCADFINPFSSKTIFSNL
jgi:hypothetical protein